MNIWEKRRKYTLDMINAMIEYGKSINSDTDSEEYKEALFYFASDLSDDFKKCWEKDNGSLEEDKDGGWYECI